VGVGSEKKGCEIREWKSLDTKENNVLEFAFDDVIGCLEHLVEAWLSHSPHNSSSPTFSAFLIFFGQFLAYVLQGPNLPTHIIN
jgi:hypothetical protein